MTTQTPARAAAAAPARRRRARTLTARRVRRARRLIAKEACPARWGIRHRWTGPVGGIWYRCTNCRTLA